MKLNSWQSHLLVLSFFAAAGKLYAQTACPVGVPPGDPRCGPSPDWHQGQAQVQQAPPTPPVVITRWEMIDDRFGAIAIASNGPYGVSFDQASAEDAEASAISICRDRGGVNCRPMGAHRNSCTTYAWGGGGAVAGDPNAGRSEQVALADCARNTGAQCEIIETFCSTPVSRWVVSDTPPPGFVPKQR